MTKKLPKVFHFLFRNARRERYKDDRGCTQENKSFFNWRFLGDSAGNTYFEISKYTYIPLSIFVVDVYRGNGMESL